MSDDLNSYFLQKLNTLEKFVKNNDNDRNSILVEIHKLQQWLAGDRSLQEHRTLQMFFTYLHQRIGRKENDRDGTVAYIKYKIGYCFKKIIRTLLIDAHCPHCNGVIKEKAYLKEFKVKSLSFNECSQKTHHEIFMKVQEFARNEGVDFDKWFRELQSNEGTLQ